MSQEGVVMLDGADDHHLRAGRAGLEHALVEPLRPLGPPVGAGRVVRALHVIQYDQLRPVLAVALPAEVLAHTQGTDLDAVAGDDLIGPPAGRTGRIAGLADLGEVLGQRRVAGELILDVAQEVGGLVRGVGEQHDVAVAPVAHAPEHESQADQRALGAAPRGGHGQTSGGPPGQILQQTIELGVQATVRLGQGVSQVESGEAP